MRLDHGNENNEKPTICKRLMTEEKKKVKLKKYTQQKNI